MLTWGKGNMCMCVAPGKKPHAAVLIIKWTQTRCTNGVLGVCVSDEVALCIKCVLNHPQD